MSNIKVVDFNEDRKKAVIEVLERFLEVAKEGEISDLIIIGKVTGESFSEVLWDTEDRLGLIGSLEYAKADVIKTLLDDADAMDGLDDDD